MAEGNAMLKFLTVCVCVRWDWELDSEPEYQSNKLHGAALGSFVYTTQI